MITLAHDFDLETCSLENEHPAAWPTCCFVGAFRGMQSFIVNGVDFSCEQAILFFAKRLNWVLRELENKTGPFIVEDLDSTWSIFLERKGELVIITPGPMCCSAKGPVSVGYGVLRVASDEYLQRAFHDACIVFPPLLENRYMFDWINSQ